MPRDDAGLPARSAIGDEPDLELEVLLLTLELELDDEAESKNVTWQQETDEL